MMWNAQHVHKLVWILAALDLVVTPLSVYCICPILKPGGLLYTCLNYIIYFLVIIIAFAYVINFYYQLCEIISKTRWADNVDGMGQDGHWQIMHHILVAGLFLAALANRSWIVALCMAVYVLITSGGVVFVSRKVASAQQDRQRLDAAGEDSRLI